MNKKTYLVIDYDSLPDDINLDQLKIIYDKYEQDPFLLITEDSLKVLEYNKYIKITDYSTLSFELRQKAIDLLKSNCIFYYDLQKEFKEDDFEKQGIESWINDYRKLFKATGASGKVGDKKSTIKKMQWFMKEYPEYSVETIMTATQKYIDQEAHNNFKYLQRSDYFISKEDTSKVKVSRLASFCEEVEEDDYEKEKDYGSFNKML